MAKKKRTNNNLQNTPQETSLVITASTITSAQNSEVSGITSCVQRDMQITCGLIFELGLCKSSFVCRNCAQKVSSSLNERVHSRIKQGSCFSILSFLRSVLQIIVCPFFFSCCIVCPYSIQFTASDCPFVIFKLFFSAHDIVD